ncbi:hypothetical protein QBC38DRAFT_413087 [Podospora fimiseda]|uniref:Uncharacterized protein n=1 Tax=Podospora fimiseda TaxID=252190 RepID=A0AAN7BT78_9PEZI|nr:hypothetical protein QBC38DRAFT_413087 [Podospora fimiseda]
MPPTLDISRTGHHPRNGILPPRMNLRRAKSYNHEKGPLSSTSSRFNFNHLVFSPPPSPGLPSLSPPVMKPKKTVLGFRPIRLVRYSIRILSVVVVFFIALEVLTQLFGPDVPEVTSESEPVVEVEMVSQKGTPDFPTPIVLTNHRGKAKWTVSIPPGTSFPLKPEQYTEVCRKCRQVAARAHEIRSQGTALQQFSLLSDSPEYGFVDVQEAQKAGYLVTQVPDWIDTRKPICKKSLTFVLESKDAGLGRSLLMLWTAYGLAQKEGRAFFIDDTRWAYGKYADIFQPPPVPSDCSPPPTNEIIPCPRQARHLVVSAATADEFFDVLNTESPYGPSESHDDVSRKKQFDLARQGHDALFYLNEEDNRYVETRIRQLAAKRIVPKTKGQQMGIAVGVHVRRGDRHPLEIQYSRSYLPLNMYSDLARETVENRFNRSGPFGKDDKEAKRHSIMILASDDPMVYETDELRANLGGMMNVYPAQSRIKLAHKQMIEKSRGEAKTTMHKYEDESFGWEGGFFAAMFWSLGMTTPNAAAKVDEKMESESLRLRSLVGRAYMMDLAVLADASDVVVCTVSAAGCRLLGVMMGWDSAIVKGEWKNIDGGFKWMGVE